MRAVFTADKMLSCLKADVVIGENGPLQLDAATGEVSANVRVWVDMEAYKAFVNEIIGKIGPMAEKREEFSKVEESVRGVFDNRGRGFSWEVAQEGPRYQLAVVSNYRSGKLILYSFDEEKGKKLCLAVLPQKDERRFPGVEGDQIWARHGDLPEIRLQTTLLDKAGEEIKIAKTFVVKEIYGRTHYTHGGIFHFYDHAFRTIVVAPFVACYGTRYGGNRPEAVVAGFGETTIHVSFGRMQEDELADISGVQAEILLVDKNAE